MDQAAVALRYGPTLLPLLPHLSRILWSPPKYVIYIYQEGAEENEAVEKSPSMEVTEEGYRAFQQGPDQVDR